MANSFNMKGWDKKLKKDIENERYTNEFFVNIRNWYEVRMRMHQGPHQACHS